MSGYHRTVRTFTSRQGLENLFLLAEPWFYIVVRAFSLTYVQVSSQYKNIQHQKTFSLAQWNKFSIFKLRIEKRINKKTLRSDMHLPAVKDSIWKWLTLSVCLYIPAICAWRLHVRKWQHCGLWTAISEQTVCAWI